MKKAVYFLIVLLIPLLTFAQSEPSTKGFRAGVNLTPLLFGEYGITIERYSGNQSIYFSFAYMTEKQFNRKTLDDDYDFNVGTYFYLPSHGPIFRLGYKFELQKFTPRARFFIMPELIYRQNGFDHITFYRKSDKDPLEQTISMCGKRYGGAIKFGWQNSFSKTSKVYWELNIAIGALYRNDAFMLYYSRYHTTINLQELYREQGWMPTYALNFIIGFDFSK